MHIELPFVDCTDFISDRSRLLEHSHQNGYLFFRGLLPTEPVFELRRQVLHVAAQHELLEPGTHLDAAIRRKGVFICEQDGSETFRRFYIDVQKLRLFHALPPSRAYRASSGSSVRQLCFDSPTAHLSCHFPRRASVYHPSTSGFPPSSRCARYVDGMDTIGRL